MNILNNLLSLLYYIGTLSIFIVAIVYPHYWVVYANRPIYEIVSYSNYSIIVSVEAKDSDCFRIMDNEIALERLKFVNEINTWLVLFFTICDWIIMMICSVGAVIIFYKAKKESQSIDHVKAHIFIEFLSIVSLLVISPLSYPSLIDDYSDCLDDNPLMRYDFFIFIELFFFVTAGFIFLQLVLFEKEDSFTKLYGKKIYSAAFKAVRNLNILLLFGFFAISLVITFGTNSLLVLSAIILDSGVGMYTLYTNSAKIKSFVENLPINLKVQEVDT